MQLPLTPEQEAQLSHVARYTGAPVERLSTDCDAEHAATQDRFPEAAEKSLAAADRGELIEEDEMDARVEKMLRR